MGVDMVTAAKICAAKKRKSAVIRTATVNKFRLDVHKRKAKKAFVKGQKKALRRKARGK